MAPVFLLVIFANYVMSVVINDVLSPAHFQSTFNAVILFPYSYSQIEVRRGSRRWTNLLAPALLPAA